MGQYFSMSTLVKVAFGRPYVDVFGVDDEETTTQTNETTQTTDDTPAVVETTLRLRVPRSSVRVVGVAKRVQFEKDM